MDVQDDDQIDEGLGEHDLHLMDDDPGQTVSCAHCGRQIWTYAQRCPRCGVHFSGEAWEFRFDSMGQGLCFSVWLWLVVGLILLAFVILWVRW